MGPRRSIMAMLCVALLAACAAPLRPPPATEIDVCRERYAVFDAAVRAGGAGDAEAARIEGFPYLRVDRGLAGLEVRDEARFNAWVARLRVLDREARAIEFANLPEAARARLMANNNSDVLHGLDACGECLARSDLSDPARRRELTARARVPDDYRTSWRVLGVYPVAKLFAAVGVAHLQKSIHATFATPLAALPVSGTLTRYVPPTQAVLAPADVAAIVTRAADNPLARPELVDADYNSLFAAFAPVWEIDVATAADRIGAPRLNVNGDPEIDTAQPVVYRRVSQTRFAGRTLLQLNYVAWFPARPCTGVFDILCGALDGITWRVTLGLDGRPLMYDVMHNCGCYHMFFPAAGLRVTPSATSRLEPLLVPQTAPTLEGAARIVVRLAARTHYLERVYAEANIQGTGYRFDEYVALRSLEIPDDGHKSLFGPNGIVPGTERAERWLLWPLGVPAPGAMRQWGHHATAFIGRRHFDDPDLLERLFTAAGESR